MKCRLPENGYCGDALAAGLILPCGQQCPHKPIRVESQNKGHYALVREEASGAEVTIYRFNPRERLGTWLFECPFHAALDAVYEIIYPLPDVAPRFTYFAELGRVVDRLK